MITEEDLKKQIAIKELEKMEVENELNTQKIHELMLISEGDYEEIKVPRVGGIRVRHGEIK